MIEITLSYSDNLTKKLCRYINQKRNIEFDIPLVYLEIVKDIKTCFSDVRHKFEKKKRRKLTKDEKRVFIKMTQNHIASIYKTNSKQSAVKELSSNNSSIVKKSVEAAVTVEKKPKSEVDPNTLNKVKILNGQRETTTSGKRKLDEDVVTPPTKRSAYSTVRQQIKSAEKHPGSGEKKAQDVVTELKRGRQLLGKDKNGVLSPSGTPYQYKGLRGKKCDIDSQSFDMCLSDDEVNEPVKKPDCEKSLANGFDKSLEEANFNLTLSPVDLKENCWLNTDTFSKMVSPRTDKRISVTGFVSSAVPTPTGIQKASLIDLSSSDDDDEILRSLETAASKGRRKRGRGRGRGRGEMYILLFNFLYNSENNTYTNLHNNLLKYHRYST